MRHDLTNVRAFTLYKTVRAVYAEICRKNGGNTLVSVLPEGSPKVYSLGRLYGAVLHQNASKSL